MTGIISHVKLDDLLFPGTVTLLSTCQLIYFGLKVGTSRRKHKISYPEMSGDPAFERTLRAQMNTLEFHPIFMSCLWLSSIFFDPASSSALGLVYIFSRHMYFNGYCQSVEGRLPGFRLGGRCLQAFLLMSVGGLVTLGLRRYTDIDLAEITSSFFQKIWPRN